MSEKLRKIFWSSSKKYFLSELRKKFGYSFDVKIHDLSIYDVFRTIWALWRALEQKYHLFSANFPVGSTNFANLLYTANKSLQNLARKFSCRGVLYFCVPVSHRRSGIHSRVFRWTANKLDMRNKNLHEFWVNKNLHLSQ